MRRLLPRRIRVHLLRHGRAGLSHRAPRPCRALRFPIAPRRRSTVRAGKVAPQHYKPVAAAASRGVRPGAPAPSRQLIAATINDRFGAIYTVVQITFRSPQHGANDPVFASRKGGRSPREPCMAMVNRAAASAGVNAAISPHWLRHAHGSHAIEKGANEVQATLGRQYQNGPVATYSSSGLKTRLGNVSSKCRRLNAIAPRVRREPA